MRTQSADTTPETEKVLVEGFRRFPSWRKFQRIVEITEFIHRLALEEIRQRYPLASDRELKLRLVSRWIDSDLMRKAFGWDTKKEGF